MKKRMTYLLTILVLVINGASAQMITPSNFANNIYFLKPFVNGTRISFFDITSLQHSPTTVNEIINPNNIGGLPVHFPGPYSLTGLGVLHHISQQGTPPCGHPAFINYNDIFAFVNYKDISNNKNYILIARFSFSPKYQWVVEKVVELKLPSNVYGSSWIGHHCEANWECSTNSTYTLYMLISEQDSYLNQFYTTNYPGKIISIPNLENLIYSNSNYIVLGNNNINCEARFNFSPDFNGLDIGCGNRLSVLDLGKKVIFTFNRTNCINNYYTSINNMINSQKVNKSHIPVTFNQGFCKSSFLELISSPSQNALNYFLYGAGHYIDHNGTQIVQTAPLNSNMNNGSMVINDAAFHCIH